MGKRKTPRTQVSALPPPVDLPSDALSFYLVGGDFGSLLSPPEVSVRPALARLGPPPFPRGGFPLLGFLSTLYEHVAQSANAVIRPACESASAGEDALPGADRE